MSDQTNAMAPTTGPMPAAVPSWTPQDDYDRGFAAAKREFIDLMRGWRGIDEPDDNTPLEMWNWALHTATEEFIPRVERMRPVPRKRRADGVSPTSPPSPPAAEPAERS